MVVDCSTAYLCIDPHKLNMKFKRRRIVRVFQKDEFDKIYIPKLGKIIKYKEAIATRHPNLIGVWAMMNRLSLYLQ